MAKTRTCARCGMDTGETGDFSGDSSILCGVCRAVLIRYDSVKLQSFLELLMAPVLVVDDHGIIVTANKTAQKALNKNLLEIRGVPGGNVMECCYAWLPEGCGRTVHCDGCAIRRTVMATYEDGVARNRVEAFQELKGADGNPVAMRIFISTEKVADLVLLRIDGMSPAEKQDASIVAQGVPGSALPQKCHPNATTGHRGGGS